MLTQPPTVFDAGVCAETPDIWDKDAIVLQAEALFDAVYKTAQRLNPEGNAELMTAALVGFRTGKVCDNVKKANQLALELISRYRPGQVKGVIAAQTGLALLTRTARDKMGPRRPSIGGLLLGGTLLAAAAAMLIIPTRMEG